MFSAHHERPSLISRSNQPEIPLPSWSPHPDLEALTCCSGSIPGLSAKGVKWKQNRQKESKRKGSLIQLGFGPKGEKEKRKKKEGKRRRDKRKGKKEKRERKKKGKVSCYHFVSIFVVFLCISCILVKKKKKTKKKKKKIPKLFILFCYFYPLKIAGSIPEWSERKGKKRKPGKDEPDLPHSSAGSTESGFL